MQLGSCMCYLILAKETVDAARKKEVISFINVCSVIVSVLTYISLVIDNY